MAITVVEPQKSTVDHNVITLDIKQRKKVISLRVDESAIAAIDRYLTANGLPSRTAVLSRLVEAFANGVNGERGRLREIKLVLLFNSVGDREKSERQVIIRLA
ncbi:hypothetical protein [Thermogladius sp.]|uniref:hypothetical protein n=1 Tax=Thermogladius sp. TaxID=2023064 RepID=UPI003D09CC17